MEALISQVRDPSNSDEDIAKGIYQYAATVMAKEGRVMFDRFAKMQAHQRAHEKAKADEAAQYAMKNPQYATMRQKAEAAGMVQGQPQPFEPQYEMWPPPNPATISSIGDNHRSRPEPSPFMAPPGGLSQSQAHHAFPAPPTETMMPMPSGMEMGGGMGGPPQSYASNMNGGMGMPMAPPPQGFPPPQGPPMPTTDSSYMPSFEGLLGSPSGMPSSHPPNSPPLTHGHVAPTQMSQLGFNKEPPGRKRSGGGYSNTMQGAGAGIAPAGGQGEDQAKYLDMSSETTSDGLPVF